MEKQKKQVVVENLKDLMDSAGSLYLIDFMGMSVAEVNELRDEFYKSNIKYKVAKNTLALISLKESEKYSQFYDDLKSYFVGPTGIVFGGDDPGAPAKLIKKLSSKTEKPKLKAAVVDNLVYDGSKLNDLASLLSKEEIIAGVVSSLNSPISGIVGTLNALIKDLLSVIEEVAKKNAA
jgi:Ribosomal protein L10